MTTNNVVDCAIKQHWRSILPSPSSASMWNWLFRMLVFPNLQMCTLLLQIYANKIQFSQSIWKAETSTLMQHRSCHWFRMISWNMELYNWKNVHFSCEPFKWPRLHTEKQNSWTKMDLKPEFLHAFYIYISLQMYKILWNSWSVVTGSLQSSLLFKKICPEVHGPIRSTMSWSIEYRYMSNVFFFTGF